MTHEYEKLKPPSHRTSQTQLNMPGVHSETNSLTSLQIQSSGAHEENPEHKENVDSRNCTDNKPRHLSQIAKIQAQVGAGNNRGSGLSFTHRLIAIVLAILMLISGPKCHYNYERLVKTLGDLRRGETVPLPREFVPPLSHHKAFTDHPSESHTNEDLIKTSENNYDNIRLKDVVNRTPNCSCVNSPSQKCKVLLHQTLLMVYDKPNERGVSLCTGKENHTLMSTIGCGWNNCGSRKSDKKWTLLNVSRSNQRKQDTMGEPTAGVSESRSETFLSVLLGMKCSCHLAEAGRVFSGGSIKRLPPPSKGRVPIDGKWHTKTSEKYYTNPKGARITKASHFNLQYVLGHKIAFMCVARGSPLPHITWFKDGVELYAHKYMQLHEWTRGHKLKSKMEIDPASQADAGIYECHANNKYAVDSRAFRTTYLAEFN